MCYSRIKDLREDKDWTQQRVADFLFVSRRTYSGYETGSRTPPPEILVRIAKLYGVSVDYLLGLTDNPKFPGP